MAGEGRLRVARALLGGMGIGAGLSWALDPRQGRRRRAMLRDAAVHLFKQQREVLEKGSLDLQHRVVGAFEQARSRSDAADDALARRVRARLGRHVTHPSAIEVQASGHRVTLSGPILAHEAAGALRCAARVPGAQEVEDRLERHAQPDGVPALQGAGRLPRSLLRREVWPPSLRLVAIGSGIGLGAYGVARQGAFGRLCALVGGGLVVRGVTNLPLRRMFGAGAGASAVSLTKSIFIEAPVEEVFAFWRRLEDFPRFMEHVLQVHPSEREPGRSHWVVEGPGGVPVSFDAVVTRLVDDEVFAWRTVPNPVVEHTGIIHFVPEGDGTRLHIHLSYTPPLGALGHAALCLLGSDPRSRMDDDLMRMKSLVEEGKTRAHGARVRLADIRAGG
ncbi:MAG: SRPBCC family protein [Planctomycetes bacterium]|nr:SRPBCC family protein [Planctomycetota bacterium]